VTALIAWPRFHSPRAEPQGDKQMAAPAEPRTPNLHRAKQSLLESADGSMATVATRREENDVSRSPNRINLTPTGLLMEGDFTALIHGQLTDSWPNQAWLLNNSLAEKCQEDFPLGSPTSDVRASGIHFLSPKFGGLRRKGSFSTATGDYTHWALFLPFWIGPPDLSPRVLFFSA
jgi:hypothetical protein